jgi:hypothetical protein
MPSKNTSTDKISKLKILREHLVSINSQLIGVEKIYIMPLVLKTERKAIAKLISTNTQLLSRIETRIRILETHGQSRENSEDRADSV